MTAAVSTISKRPRDRPRKPARKQPLILVQPVSPTPRALPRLEQVERTGTVLRPSPLAEGKDEICSLNLLSGCPHRCTFCYARAYPGYPGDEVVYLYANTADRLRGELRQRHKRPRAVYLCPSTDPFPPYAEAQAEAGRVMEALAEQGIEAWIMTRGFIRPSAMEVLIRQQDLVRVTIGITTLDKNLSRTLEPLAAPPRLRLRQITQLRRAGVLVQAAVDPLIPGVTDTRENLDPLVDALAEAGVERLTAGYLFLRQGIRNNLLEDLGPLGWAEPILERYQFGPVLPMGSIAPAKHLPRPDRQRGYARLMALASARGLSVSLCRTTNPDFRTPRTLEPRPERGERQLVLRYGE